MEEFSEAEAFEVRSQKKALRLCLRARRERIPEEERRCAAEKIRANLAKLPAYRQADVVFCYVSFGSEAGTQRILSDVLESGRRLAVPRCGKAGSMEACEIRSLEDLAPGFRDILEPREGCRIVRPEEIGLVLLPCLSAGRDGTRLGYGGGYYDRYLTRMSAARQEGRSGRTPVFAALCYADLVREGLPREPHDVLADEVVTERGILHCQKRCVDARQEEIRGC